MLICDGVATGDQFDGYVDEVAFYLTALLATRVNDHFKAGLGVL